MPEQMCASINCFLFLSIALHVCFAFLSPSLGSSLPFSKLFRVRSIPNLQPWLFSYALIKNYILQPHNRTQIQLAIFPCISSNGIAHN